MMKELWIDTRLAEEEVNFLWDAISDPENEGVNYNHALVGNIFKSELIKDKNNWFFKSTLKKLSEKMFYDDWDNYCKYHKEKEESLPIPKFELSTLWVNHQNQHEFNPLPHIHTALYSFVVFMKIPTHWKDQYALPFSAHSIRPCASDFQFVWTQKDSEELIFRNFSLSPEDEGRILFFPSTLQHQVYPFYGTEEKRVTISGNIDSVITNSKSPSSSQEVVTQNLSLWNSLYEEKEKILKMLENNVKITKKELKWMKKHREKAGEKYDE